MQTIVKTEPIVFATAKEQEKDVKFEPPSVNDVRDAIAGTPIDTLVEILEQTSEIPLSLHFASRCDRSRLDVSHGVQGERTRS